MNVTEKIAKATKSVLFKEPFYGLYLIGVNKEYTERIKTAAVAPNGIGVQLLINRNYVDSLSLDHTCGLLKHELLHIAFGHILISDLYSDKKLFNIAADLEINQYIDPNFLPEGAVKLDSFPELKLPAKAGTKFYYDALMNAKDEGVSQDLNNLLNEMEGDSNHPVNHQWDDFKNMTPLEKKMIDDQINHQIKNVAEQIKKSSGTIPGELHEKIEKLFKIEPPKFNWKAYLRRFIGGSKHTFTTISKRKPNFRFKHLAGIKIKEKCHICVAIDVSASVSTDELKEFFNEITHMHRTGNTFTIVQCDTKIRSIKEFNPKDDWDVNGRAGTLFQPVIDHYNKKKGRYEALIYLTDGEAAAPVNCPKNTLWVHSSNSRINQDLPGYKIKF